MRASAVGDATATGSAEAMGAASELGTGVPLALLMAKMRIAIS